MTNIAIDINQIAARYEEQKDHISTEEATKTALVMPFFSALGYDVFNPQEVTPEFVADVGIKKGEKVDYAIKKDGEPIMLVECKWCGSDLTNQHASQLYRYFSTVKARFAVLTNGLRYQFYSDIEDANKLDEHPFFVFDVLDHDEHHIKELSKFAKAAFSLENILNTASRLKYTNAVKDILDKELSTPSESFVRFFASQIYDGRLTQQVLEEFSDIVLEARKQFINERVSQRLKTALQTVDNPVLTQDADISDDVEEDGIVTTVEEIEGYHIVKAILREVVDINRVVMRDTKSYCGILLDDNNRKPICRLHFNYSTKYIGLFDRERNEERIVIESLNDIFKYAEQLLDTVHIYDKS